MLIRCPVVSRCAFGRLALVFAFFRIVDARAQVLRHRLLFLESGHCRAEVLKTFRLSLDFEARGEVVVVVGTGAGRLVSLIFTVADDDIVVGGYLLG